MAFFRFRKIEHRVFFYIFISLTVLITLILVMQVLFFGDWYQKIKLKDVEENLYELFETIENKEYDIDNLYRITDRFQEENGIIVYLMDPQIVMEDMLYEDVMVGETWSSEAVYVVRTENEMDYYLQLDVEGNEEIIESIQVGTDLSITGIIDEEFIYALIINELNVEQNQYVLEVFSHNGFATDPEIIMDMRSEGIIIEGEVKILESVHDTFDDTVYNYDAFDKEMYEDMGDGLSSYVIELPFTDDRTVVYQKEITTHEGYPMMVFVEVSLQNITEMMEFLTPFFLMFYVIGFVMVILLAKLLSVRITRPIVEMTTHAEKIAMLDFTKAISNKSKDELGQLATSINFMSDNLEKGMDQLKKANNQLLQDIEKERERERARKEFVANVSHELKTPLGIAKGYVEAVLDGIRKDKHDDYLKITLHEMDRMNQIVLNMLDLMKHENSHQSLQLTLTDLKPVMTELQVYFEVLLASKSMSLKVDKTLNSAVVELNTFKSLMLNLISNAIHYGVAGTDIFIRTFTVGDRLYIRIENIVASPEEIDLDRIWHKFYTVDQSHNRSTSGTGLGLSIVKSILERYGSEYKVTIVEDTFIAEFTLKSQ